VKTFLVTLVAIWAIQQSAWAAPQASSKSQKRAQASSQAKAPARAKNKLRATVAARQKLDAARSRSDTVEPVRLGAALRESAGHPDLKSSSAFVVDQSGRTLYAKNITSVQPIASITKLMTAMVVLDAKLDLSEPVTISEEDVDGIKHTRSRLPVGTVLTRDDLLRLALMASENRAASALGRAYPGGSAAFIAAMNRKAVELGMTSTHFNDSTGLSRENVSTAEDLAKMVAAAYRFPVIQQYTTLTDHTVRSNRGRMLAYHNSNGLVRSDDWNIDVSKTGYISEAGRCLVMQARISATPVIIVLLDSWGKYTRIADANRVKKWVESQLARPAPG
jgi:serine-type D-Ala-D-Ala endopeptidase (penicillin-binding protein 7)